MGSLLKMVKDNTKIRQNRNKAPNRSKLKCYIIIVKKSVPTIPRFIEISEQTPQLTTQQYRFIDGNNGEQGTGGLLIATGSTQVIINDPSTDWWPYGQNFRFGNTHVVRRYSLRGAGSSITAN